MIEKRTQTSSGLLICQHCGVVLKTQSKTCRDCGNVTSRHSTTLIPVLVINRKPATAPQHLKPENDPLIMERVVTRCKFNDAMKTKPKVFHGSRAFFSDQTYEHAGGQQQKEAPAQPTAVSNPTPNQEFDPFARQSGPTPAMLQPGPAPAPIGQTAPEAPGMFPLASQTTPETPGMLPSATVPASEISPQVSTSTQADGRDTVSSFFEAMTGDDRSDGQSGQNHSTQAASDANLSATAPSSNIKLQNDPGGIGAANVQLTNDPGPNIAISGEAAPFDVKSPVSPVDAGSPNIMSQQSNSIGEIRNPAADSPAPVPTGNQSAPARTGSEEKVVRPAHPSYMVADCFLLVVQEHDGQTLSLTQTIDGPELEPVFGLLPAPDTFDLCAPQVMPDASVSLSGSSLSFHDANQADASNKDDESSAAPEVDTSINIDSRLAFEEGLSRVAALRLQGALGRSGVLGFETTNNEDIRKKFTTRKGLQAEADEEDAVKLKVSGATDEASSGPPKIKERSVFKPQRAPVETESLNKIEAIGDIKPIKPKKNPLAMVGAAVGIVAVLAVIGFVGLQKFGEFTSDSTNPSATATTGGVTLPNQWHIVLTRTMETQTIYQDFTTDVNQSGSTLSGKGRDAIGDFTLSGDIAKDNSINLQKQYDSAGYIWPIMFSGKVGQGQNGSFASGSYVWRKSDQERVQGEWQASLPQAMNSAPNQPTANQMSPPNPGQAPPAVNQTTGNSNQNNGQFNYNYSNTGWSKQTFEPSIIDRIIVWFGPRFTTDWFTKLAWVTFISLVSIGSLTYAIFYFLFSPNGKLNRLEKEKYIPSQFRREHAKTLKNMSSPLKPGGLPLGNRVEWRWWKFWTSRTLSFTPELREDNPNLLLLGASGRGKTRLMSNMVAHDIRSNDRAVVIVDSDGTLSELIIDWMSSQPNKKELLKRTIAIDPTRDGDCLTYNPLESPEPANMQTAASALVHGFKAIYAEPPGSQTAWNAQTANILRNAAVLLMANGRTLVDLPTLLQDNDFRDIMLERVERLKDERSEYLTLLEAWANYKKLARTDQWINWVEPILNRVTPVLSDPRIRPILTAPHSELSLERVVEDKKILIVKLPQGELDQNASLLGSLIVTGVQQAAITLKRKKKSVSRRVSLYLDDLDTFVEQDTLENLAQEFRRYQISVTGTLKTLQHLQEDYRNKLVVNIHTYCVFSLAKKDADILGGQIFRVDGRKFKAKGVKDFVNPLTSMPNYELIMDEEKLSVDRLVGQAKQTFFCYSFGSVASVFQLKAETFPRDSKQVPDEKMQEMIYSVKSVSAARGPKGEQLSSEGLKQRYRKTDSLLSVTEDEDTEPEPRNRLNFDLRRAFY